MNNLKTYKQRVLDGEIYDPEMTTPDQFTKNLKKVNIVVNIGCVILVITGIIALIVWR